jgi:hypothetical protein
VLVRSVGIYYCADVRAKSRQSWKVIDLDPGASEGVTMRLASADHPGLAVQVVFSAEAASLRGDAQYMAPLSFRVAVTEPAGRALTARTIDAIPFGAVVAEAWRMLTQGLGNEEVQGWNDPDSLPELATRLTQRPGRRKRPEIEWAELARNYVDALEREPDRPVEALAESLNMKRKTVSNALESARRRGLLTRPRKQGAAGGRLTAKAKRLLDEGTEDGTR